jgi:hypothetical protein
LERHPDQVNWYGLSRNPAAVHILERNLDKVNWGCCFLLNPAAVLERHLNQVNWEWLSGIRRPSLSWNATWTR